jgi:capsular exopolysaccharide synthesis family protein
MSSFWRGRWILLGCITVTTLLALGYLWHAPERYRSSSQVQLESTQPQALEALASFQQKPSDLHAQAEIIRSRQLLSSAAELLNKPGSPASPVLNEAPALKRNLRVSVDSRSGTLTVSMLARQPETAARAANAVVQAYVDYRKDKQQSSTSQLLKILKKEKARQQRQLEKLRQRMLQFRREHGAASLGLNDNSAMSNRLRTVADQLSKAQERVAELKFAVDAGEQAKGNPPRLKQLVARQLRAVPSDATGPNSEHGQPEAPLRRLSGKLRAELESMRGHLGPNHPVYRSTERQLHGVQRRLDRQPESPETAAEPSARYLDVLRDELKLAKKKRQHLEQQLESLTQNVPERDAEAAKYHQLKARAQRQEQTLDTLHKRGQELSLKTHAPATRIDVLEPAQPASEPVRPRRAQILAMAVMLGLIFGCGGAYLYDRCDQRFRSADEFSTLLGAPVLGTIPHTAGGPGPAAPHAEVSEAYRTLGTMFCYGSAAASARTVLLTSPLPGEGKTRVAVNFAAALAQAGEHALVVDANCRRPAIHEILGLDPNAGAPTLVSDGPSIAETVQYGEPGSLSVLSLGPALTNPVEMLNSDAFTRTLDELAGRYDRLVIDSPAVMPVSDARILAARCDATVMVLRPDRSDRRVAMHASDMLADVGAQLVGLVVNAVPRRGHYGWYGHAGYSCHRGRGRLKHHEPADTAEGPGGRSSKGRASGTSIRGVGAGNT